MQTVGSRSQRERLETTFHEITLVKVKGMMIKT